MKKLLTIFISLLSLFMAGQDLKFTSKQSGFSKVDLPRPLSFDKESTDFYFLLSRGFIVVEFTSGETVAYNIVCTEKTGEGQYLFELKNEVEETELTVDFELEIFKFKVKQGYLYFIDFKNGH